MGIASRTNNHGPKVMTLWVTRQDESFVISNDEEFVDIRLISATTQLVGEPGFGGRGTQVATAGVVGFIAPAPPEVGHPGYFHTHRMSTNYLYDVNNSSESAIVRGVKGQNRILTRNHLDHSNCNVEIIGMTQDHNFKQDKGKQGNNLMFVVPTDLGLDPMKAALACWPPSPINLHKVHLAPTISIHTTFMGIAPEPEKRARFVADWADEVSTRRRENGQVIYYESDNESSTINAVCTVPSNLIQSMKLVFEVAPKSLL